MRVPSRLLVAAIAMTALGVTTADAVGTASVAAKAETLDHKPAGTNDADDPAFWVDRSDPAKSLIIGTVKEGGLDVYRSDGTLLQNLPAGSGHRLNNVDVLYGVALGGTARDLAVVSDRGTDKLHVYAIDGASNAPLTEVTASSAPLLFGTKKKVASKTAYGLAGWTNPAGDTGEVYVTQENTTNLAKLALTDAGGGKVGYTKVASLSLPDHFTLPTGATWTPCFNPKHPDWTAHVEGMVVDPATGTLWADQEIVGLWKIRADLTAPQLVHKLARFGQTYSTAGGKCKINASSPSYGEAQLPGDLEGIGLYRAGTGGYLIISNQMASTFAVFTRDGTSYVGTFRIVDSAATDKVDQTDGLDVTNVPLGPAFPNGLLVTQDGKDAPQGGTNFKLTPWPSVATALGLVVDTSGSPRS